MRAGPDRNIPGALRGDFFHNGSPPTEENEVNDRAGLPVETFDRSVVYEVSTLVVLLSGSFTLAGTGVRLNG